MSSAKSYADYVAEKKKKEEEERASSSNNKTYADYVAKKSASEVNQEYINSFVTDFNNYATQAQSDYNNLGYGNANSYYTQHMKTGNDLEKRAKAINNYLNLNKDAIDPDSYKEISSYVNQTITAINTTKNAFKDADGYYSQFNTEEEYNDYSKGVKTREELLSYDLVAGENDIKNLESQLADLKKTKSDYDSKYKKDGGYIPTASNYNRPSASQIAPYNEWSAKSNEYQKKIEAMETELAEKKRYHGQAKHIQTSNNLSNTAINAEDFDLNVKKGGNNEVANKRAEYAEEYGESFGEDYQFGEATLSLEDRFAKYATDEEMDIYSYYVGKGDDVSAQAYLIATEETINARKGLGMHADVGDNLALQYAFTAASAVQNFGVGWGNLFSDKDYYAPTATQMASQAVNEDLAEVGPVVGGKSLGQIGYDLVYTTANMLPSILASSLVTYATGGIATPAVASALGGAVGSVTLGASAAGNAYAEMINLGYDKGQARAYSALVGGSEAGLQYLFGGIGKLGGKLTGKGIGAVVNNIDNAFAKAAIKFGGNMISEGFEEYAQEILDPFFRNIAFNESNEVRLYTPEAMYSGILGALSAGFLEGVPSAVNAGTNALKTLQTGKTLTKNADFDVSRLVELGKTFSADSVAYKIADKVNDKTGAYTIGKLFHSIGAELSAQNKADIVKSLTRKGVAEKNATTIADWLSAVVDGAKLSKMQIKALELNEDIANTFRDVVINKNSTFNQRRQAFFEAGGVDGYTGISTQAMSAINNPDAIAGRMEVGLADSQGIIGSRAAPKLSDFESQLSQFAHETANGVSPEISNDGPFIPTAKQPFVPARTVEKIKSIEGAKAKEHEVSSTEGKTILLETDEVVSIKRIASTEGKSMKLELSDGRIVSSKDVSYGSQGEALVYETVANMDVPVDVANSIMSMFDSNSGQSATVFAKGIEEAYRYGYFSIPKAEMLTRASFAPELTDKQREDAYKLGSIMGKKDSKKSPKTTGKRGAVGKGKVHFDGDRENLKPHQKAALDALEVIAEVTGLQIEVFESPVVNGRRVGENGSYDPKTGVMRIDLHAGISGNGLMLFTAAHEIGHHIKNWSPAKFKVLADFLMEQYAEKGISVDELIQRQIDKAKANGRTLTYEEAYEEFVCDSLETMLADGAVIEKLKLLANKDKSLVREIKRVLKDLVKKIKEAYAKLTPDSDEGKLVAEMVDATEELHNLFAEALMDATENYTSAESDFVSIDKASESASPKLSERTWTASDYVVEREATAKMLANALGVTKKKALAYIDNVNSIAKMIADDRARLDYEASPFGSAFVSNSEYGGSFDFTTLCKKRRLYTGTFSEIQKRLGDVALTPDDILAIRNMLIEKHKEATCGLCYVEGSRANMGKFAKEFIRLYKRDNPDAWIPSMYDVNTPDGVESMKINHPEAFEQYEYFWNHYGKLQPTDKALFASQQKPKLYESRKEYKGEILHNFSKDSTVAKKNLNGGIRMQSFSDFEIVHLIDTMQIIMDMSSVGLAGQAYTKVPEFADAFGNTGLKINLSLIAKGVDADGNLIFDDREGMPHETAFGLRNKYSSNVGTIIVVFTDEQLYAAMADSRIDFIIPFHRSQWKKGQYGAMGLPQGTKDYTYMQNEKLIKPTYHEYRGRMVKDKASNYMPNEYWDFSKSGKENAEAYLAMCAKNNKRPKFYKLLDYDGKGTYSLKKDGSTDGYWKLLIDFKMYDNNGVGSPQQAVTPTFSMDEAIEMLNEYKGGHQSYPVAYDVVDSFVDSYGNTADGRKFSDRDSEGRELSAGQQEYFKDSKVRDENGNLLLVHHGTSADFTVFDREKIGSTGRFEGSGFNFTPSESRASSYANSGNVMSGYLNITNPLSAEKKTFSVQKLAKLIAKIDPTGDNIISNYAHDTRDYGTSRFVSRESLVTARAIWEYCDNDADIYAQLSVANPDADTLISAFEEMGYDGVIHYNDDGTIRTLVSFSSNQFKETTNKNPTSDSDVRCSIRDEAKTDISKLLSGKNFREDIKLTEHSPSILRSQKGARDLPLVMKPGHLRENILTKQEAKKMSLKVDAHTHYHGLGKDLFIKVIDDLDSVTEAYRGTRYAEKSERRENYFLLVSQHQDKDGNVINVPIYINEQGQYNRVVFDANKLGTVFGRKQFREYIRDEIRKGNLVKIKNRSIDVSEREAEIANGYNKNASKDNIPDSTSKSQEKFSLREISDITTSDYVRMYHHFGSTKNYDVAGYLLGNGVMLDFSGKHWGDKYSTSRQVDHRDIQEVIGNRDSTNGVNAMIDMIGNGNIRLMPETGGINLAVKPNATQMSQLRGYIAHFKGEVIIDIDEVGGDTIHSWEYPRGTSASKILSDLKAYFDDGTVPKRQTSNDTDIRQFLFSDRDPDSTSPRNLLANALEGTVSNDVERKKLAEYKKKIALITAEEEKLTELRRQIKELSFSKGKRDSEKLKKLREEATKTANRINTYDRQLLSLESTTALKNVLEREKKKVAERQKKKDAEILSDYRKRAKEREQAIIDRYQESRKKATEGRHRTEMRNKIKKVVNELNQYLLHGTKDKHVMIGMQRAVAEALSIINMDTVGADERVERYDALIAEATDPDVIEALTATRDRIKGQGDKLSEKLTSLQTAYSSIINSTDPMIANAHDEVIEAKIESVAEIIGDTSIRDMSMSQLEAVYDLYKMVLTNIRKANKLFNETRQETVEELGERVNSEISEVTKRKDGMISIEKFARKIGYKELKPIYFFRMLGSDTMTSLYKAVRNGQDTWYRDAAEAKSFRLKTEKEYGYKKWDFKKTHSFESKSGKTFDLTLSQIMSVYALSRREQALDHLLKGGIVFDDSVTVTEKKKGIPIKYEVNTSAAFNLSETTLREIIDTLTPEQKAFVEKMQAYLSDTMGEKGNEVSLELYGVKLFKEKNYFPLKSSQYYMSFDSEKSGEVKIKNSSFSKETVKHANNPIVLSDFKEVWSSHVNEMSTYHSFVLPLEDFTRVYNYRTPTTDSSETTSLQSTIHDYYLESANDYIKQLLKDINGGSVSGVGTQTIDKMISLAKKGAVFASASVVVQQPSAIVRAMAYVNPKYFANASAFNFVRHNRLWEECKRYAPVAGIKEMGYFDTSVGQTGIDWIKSDEYESRREKFFAFFKDKEQRGAILDDVLSKAPAMADELSWVALWEAVKKETRKTTDLEVGSEEFFEHCGKRFTEIIDLTQVYDSVFSRSELMRSKDRMVKAATAFMSEPTTQVNMLFDAALQVKRKGKKGLGVMASVVGSVMASVVLNSLLKSLVLAGRDDDEGETFIEKYIASFTGDVLNGLNPLTLIPFVKDVISIVQGYSVDRMDMSVIDDLISSVLDLGKDSISDEAKFTGLLGSVGQLFGVPVKNILRDINTAVNVFNTVTNGNKTTATGAEASAKEGLSGTVTALLLDKLAGIGFDTSKGRQYYDAVISGDKAHADRIIASYGDKKKADTAIVDALKSYDSRVLEAAQAQINGDSATRIRLAKEIIADGFAQDYVVKAINGMVNKLNKGEDEGYNPKSQSLYSKDDYFDAAYSGNSTDAERYKEEIIRVDMENNGKTKEEAEKSFNNSFRESVRDSVLAGELTIDEASEMLTKFGGLDEDTAYNNAQYYDLKRENPNLKYNWQVETATKYYKSAEPYGISVSVYDDFLVKKAECKGSDINGDGKTDTGSVRSQVLPVIDSLPISSRQKDILYFMCDYKESTLHEAPWH